MIGHLEGVLREKAPTRVLLSVGGVGYAVQIPLSTFYVLPDAGKTVALHVHTHVREDAIQLFGFHTELERRVFELLIGASRVGPKLAQTILSGIEARALLVSIASGDVAALRSAPGVGQKMAERIVVELRDKVDAVLAAREPVPGGPPRGAAPADVSREQALSALLNLGYQKGQAERVLDAAARELGGEAIVEDLIRTALRRLSR